MNIPYKNTFGTARSLTWAGAGAVAGTRPKAGARSDL